MTDRSTPVLNKGSNISDSPVMIKSVFIKFNITARMYLILF